MTSCSAGASLDADSIISASWCCTTTSEAALIDKWATERGHVNVACWSVQNPWSWKLLLVLEYSKGNGRNLLNRWGLEKNLPDTEANKNEEYGRIWIEYANADSDTIDRDVGVSDVPCKGRRKKSNLGCPSSILQPAYVRWILALRKTSYLTAIHKAKLFGCLRLIEGAVDMKEGQKKVKG